jgi:Zn-dependent protease with chaperone function
VNRQTVITSKQTFPHHVLESLRISELSWRGAQRGLRRYPKVVLVALLGSWSLLALAIWVAVVTAIFGAVIGFFGAANSGQYYAPGSESAVGVVGAFVGALAGFAAGFAAIVGTDIIVGGLRILVSLAAGAVLAAAAAALFILFEPWLMYFHGYRPPSNREELVLNPVLRDVAVHMHLTELPQILICDTHTPGAWTHTRHIVVSKRLLDLPPGQLGGVLAHELQHWLCGDSTGLLFVTMCALPLTLTSNLMAYFAKVRLPLVALISRLVLWPYLLISKCMVQPILAAEGRGYEYDADLAAVLAGYGRGLYLALEELRPFEQARSGWEQVICATHPPMEYRLEAIEDEFKCQQEDEDQIPPADHLQDAAVIAKASAGVAETESQTPVVSGS